MGLAGGACVSRRGVLHTAGTHLVLASITDPEFSDSENEAADDQEPETISAKRTVGKGKRKAGRKKESKNDDEDESNKPSSVIYLGHLPAGFEEREINVFLNQFGSVLRCRVSRSTKTGRSRGYAFVEFADEEVAGVVAETMSGYFLLEKRLVCHVLPRDKVHELMFAKAKKVPTKADKQKKARIEVNKKRSSDAMRGITAKLVKREEMKRKKLAALGIDYDFPGYAASAAQTAESGSKNKKRKVSVDDGEDVRKKESSEDKETAATATKKDSMKTPKSQKKSKKRSASEEEKENNDDSTNNEADEAAATEEVTKSAKKSAKKASKTPSKKAKTPGKKSKTPKKE